MTIDLINKAVEAGDIPGLTFIINNSSKDLLTNEHLKMAIRNDDLAMVQYLLDNNVRALINPNKSVFDRSFEAIELAYRLGFTAILQLLKDKSIERGILDLKDLDFTTPIRITDEIHESVRIKLVQENDTSSVEEKITQLLVDYLNL